MRALFRGTVFAAAACAVFLAACGGGSGGFSSTGGGGTTPAAANVQALSVNLGPQDDYANGLFTSVEICVPGTSTCQTIDNILVDTGSTGLRLLGSAVTIPLPAQVSGSGSSGECTVFADGFTWGPVYTADIHIANELASSTPVNLLGTNSTLYPSFPTAPSACSQGAGEEEDSAAALGTNGILGVGPFQYDCGSACASDADEDLYFSCTSSSGCVSVTQAEANQVQSPVPLFATDNNGVIIQLPAIAASGAGITAGSLIFGIGTETNNAVGSATIITTDGIGNFTTTFPSGSNGTTYPNSFIDSGSNALIFVDSDIPTCSNYTSYFCPTSTLSLSATMTGQNGFAAVVPFSVANTDTLFSGDNAAFDDLGAPSGSTLGGSFDWGLPFFYGRNVYVAIENKATPAGDGPYFGFH